MRNLPVLVLSITLLISCSTENEIDPTICPEGSPVKWQLVKETGNSANLPPLTGSDMPWQEWYVFYSDSTFIKTREWDYPITEGTGTFAFVTLPGGGNFMELTFETGTDLVGNCYADPVELLWIKSEDELTSTWQMCDGPGLFYEKVEHNCLDTLY